MGFDRPQAAAAESGGKAASTGLSSEHYAWSSQMGYLNGPRQEAMGRGTGRLDDDLNMWQLGRCIRSSDDRVVTCSGNDYWNLDFYVEEGPAAYLPRTRSLAGSGYGQGEGGLVVKGRPLAGGPKNCLYTYSEDSVWKVWKNEEQAGRWWFKRIAGPGKAPIPGEEIHMGQRWRKWGASPDEDQVVFYTKTGFHILDESGGEVAFKPLLKLEDIEGPVGHPTLGVVDSGGNFYLGYYFGGAPKGDSTRIKIVRAGTKKAERYVTAVKSAKKNQDGPGMETGWHCGPHFHPPKAVSPYTPPGILFLHAHDEDTLRRVKDGRVATLYRDGEWREAPGNDLRKFYRAFAGFVAGPGGLALKDGGGKGEGGIELLRGLDVDKPTVGLPAAPDGKTGKRENGK
jgi:hypothetical protein